MRGSIDTVYVDEKPIKKEYREWDPSGPKPTLYSQSPYKRIKEPIPPIPPPTLPIIEMKIQENQVQRAQSPPDIPENKIIKLKPIVPSSQRVYSNNIKAPSSPRSTNHSSELRSNPLTLANRGKFSTVDKVKPKKDLPELKLSKKLERIPSQLRIVDKQEPIDKSNPVIELQTNIQPVQKQKNPFQKQSSKKNLLPRKSSTLNLQRNNS